MRSLEDIRELLQAGADKVSINTAAVQKPELVREASEKFGTQCIVVAVDAKRMSAAPESWAEAERAVREEDGTFLNRMAPKISWEVYVHGGRTPTGLDALQWAQKVEEYGAGEILLTSMDRDGTKIGYDIPLTRIFSDSLNIPIIASGGAGTLEHLQEAFLWGRADAVLAASIFHYRQHSIRQAKDFLRQRGIPIREA